MAANVETMFYTREKPWHGLGTRVEEAPNSKEALILAGLNWSVYQSPIWTENEMMIPGYKANIRDVDEKVLGVVTDRYKVIQNSEAFSFTDDLLGDGVTYETAGSLQDGKRTWILAKMPQRFIIAGDEITPYLVFMNSHDGSGAVKVAMTPIRVVCQNTLNLALRDAKRSWSTHHTGNIETKMQQARQTLFQAEQYMGVLGREIDNLNQIKLSDKKVIEFIDDLFPVKEDLSDQQKKNVDRMKEDVKIRYFDAPDLKHVGKNGYRFVNAVSDYATHAEPVRRTQNYKESVFARTVDGNSFIDKAYEMVLAA